MSEKNGGNLHDSATGPVADRAALRHAAIVARESMTDEEHARASRSIEDHLAALLFDRPPSVLGFCWPVRNEFDCRPLVGRLLSAGWRACLPVAQSPAAAMPFREWAPDAPMTADRYGIPIPAEGECLIPGIVLLPLVAFDCQGYRLGYGGGHFDRTLAALAPRPIAIGIGFERTRIDSIRPESHDMPLDAVVTEIGVKLYPR
ncbi:MAG: 5-formyltetrahydrofolate cyclo-ligase [Candidatus Nitricoxidivorans perseverans]|uniref:5-formyltetrahydrofolate cyclo-ligase n=1 Tax=Candidatus Nitricoxidivorans perseverans TaxID=2975601 RepID=A0AA49FJ04_9PROT|nr:MAG: 5-formyltetrahydrofolate cyclo-ligase [Candidatus Nitricoxidivorans perseverans]